MSMNWECFLNKYYYISLFKDFYDIETNQGHRYAIPTRNLTDGSTDQNLI